MQQSRPVSKKKYDRPRRRRGLRGYVLHSARLAYTGKEAIRTIKYPLYHENKNLIHLVADAVNHDYVSLYGLTNIDDYARFREKGQEVYSVIDFWLDCLRQGVFFAYKREALFEYARIISGTDATNDLIELDQNKAAGLIRSKVIALLGKNFRSNKNKKNLVKDISNCFEEDRRNGATFVSECEKLANDLLSDTTIDRQKKLLSNFFGVRRIERSLPQFTCCIVPVPIDYLSGGELVISRLQEYVGLLGLQGDVLNHLEFVGIEGNGNALSNFLGDFINTLRNGKEQKINDESLALISKWKTREGDLGSRIAFLMGKAKLLSMPKIVPSFADYRHEISGKLTGWIKNYQSQIAGLGEQMRTHTNELKQATDFLKLVIQQIEEKKPIQHLLEDVVLLEKQAMTILDAKTSANRVALLSAYRLFLPTTKEQLNRVWQKYNAIAPLGKTKKKKKPANEDGDENDFSKRFAALSKPLKEVPSFYGGSKKAMFDKYFRSAEFSEKLWGWESELVAVLLSAPIKSVEESDFFVRKIQQILNVYNKLSVPRFKTILRESIVKYIDPNVMREREVVWKSGFARASSPVIPLEESPSDHNNALKNISTAILSHLEDWKKLNDDERINYIEIRKMASALLISTSKAVLEISSWDLDGIESANAFKVISGSTYSGRMLERFSQECVYSELRGLASLMSRNEFISRSAVQGINGKQVNLVYTPRQCADITRLTVPHGMKRDFLALKTNEFIDRIIRVMPALNEEVLREMRFYPHRFGYQINTNFENLTPDIEAKAASVFFDKSSEKDRISSGKFKHKDGQVLEVRSSPYQIQFLDWFLTKPKERQCDIEIAGSFLIAEHLVKAKWDYSRLTVQFNYGEPNLYCSQPFTMVSRVKSTGPLPGRFIGIDIGEYGLGWTAIESKDKEEITLIAQGFIEEPQLAKLRGEVQKLKATQQRGTFTITSTKIADMRESIANSLRNQVHALALEHHAQIVYERQISGFETGGKKIEKLYDTLKRSDKIPKNDAEKQFRNMVWGKIYKSDNLTLAREINATGTSQLCLKCGRWYRDCLPEDLSKKTPFDVLCEASKIEKIVQFKIMKEPRGVVLVGFWEARELPASWSDLRRAVEGFMRPPKEGVTFKNYAQKAKFDDRFFKMRGNSAVYICPFGDCHNVVDCDLQASQTIATVGLLKDGDITLDRQQVFARLAKIRFLTLNI